MDAGSVQSAMVQLAGRAEMSTPAPPHFGDTTAASRSASALPNHRLSMAIEYVAAKHQVHPSQASVWKRQAVEGLKEVFSNGRSKREKNHEVRIRELHAKIGELTVEWDFFLRGLRR